MASREYGLSPFSRRQLQWEIKRVEAVTPKVPQAAPKSGRATLSILGGKSA
jgi:hypothetical protein